MSSTASLAAFARRLLKATEAGNLEWSRTPFDDKTFAARATSGTVELSRLPTGHGGIATQMTVRNGAGMDVDALVTDPSNPGPWRPWEEVLNELYDAARLMASGTTKVIEGLSAEWDLPPDPGDDPPF